MSGEERMRTYEKKLREIAIPISHISGSGKVQLPGLGEIHVSGAGFVSPAEIRISGSSHLPGGIKVGKIRGSGSVSVNGTIEADEMRFCGSVTIAGSVKAKSLSSSGSCQIGDNAEFEDFLRSRGSLRVSSSLKATNSVDIRGSFNIEGKLETDTLDVELNSSRSHVKNGIEATNISIRKGESEGIVIFGFPIFGKRFGVGKLSTTNIVAKAKVYIENVSCDNVIGREVTIEEGCTIKGRVKYLDMISVHPTASLANPPEKIG